MTDVLDVADQAYRRRQTLVRKSVLASRKAWAQVDPARIVPSWHSGVMQLLLAILTGAQSEAASYAGPAVTAMLSAQGIDGDQVGELVPAAFARSAADGRDLQSLLEISTQVALHRIRIGRTPADGLLAGGAWLEQVIRTQVADAARTSTQVATVTHRRVGGYYRRASSPCCSRCAILSGRWYRWYAAFQRHPRCDCGQVAAPSGSLDGDPRIVTADSYFGSLTAAMQERIFTKAGAQAIRDGADISQIVNARRGMYSASVGGRATLLTRSGGTGIRLMPEQIYRVADGRDDALRLLRSNGYIT